MFYFLSTSRSLMVENFTMSLVEFLSLGYSFDKTESHYAPCLLQSVSV